MTSNLLFAVALLLILATLAINSGVLSRQAEQSQDVGQVVAAFKKATLGPKKRLEAQDKMLLDSEKEIGRLKADLKELRAQISALDKAK